jgi:hypothetical protein
MPNNSLDKEFPLVAIPEWIFDLLATVAHGSVESLSVNHLVQRLLDQVTPAIITLVRQEGNHFVNESDVKKVRVKAEQFAMLQRCQKRWCERGYSVSISGIIPGLLLNESETFRGFVDQQCAEDIRHSVHVLYNDGEFGIISCELDEFL